MVKRGTKISKYLNTQQWHRNYSNPSFHFNFTNNSSLGWSSYQNTGAWSPPFSPSYGHTSKLDEALEKFLQVSSSYQDQSTLEPQITTWPESAIKFEATMERFLQSSLDHETSMETSQKNIEFSLRNIETHIGQMAKQILKLSASNNERISEEQCKAISTWSGDIIDDEIGDNLMIEEEEFERD